MRFNLSQCYFEFNQHGVPELSSDEAFMKRYFEFQDSKSYKFWQIEIEETSFTVTYGKIGTAGQVKVSNFDSEEKTQKEIAKIVAEKIKKGYVEKVEASSKKVSKRISVSYDEADNCKTLAEKVEQFCNSGQAESTESIVIGSWEEPHEVSPKAAIDLFIKHKEKLSNLKELFVGDMDSEECEISWIIQADYAEFIRAFPNLERLHIKGASDLSIGVIDHANLKSLTIECGGLPKSIITGIAESKLPSLEKLVLYLGVDDYGFDGSLSDLQPFMEKGRFPALTYLGLVNSELADEIAVAIAEAPVLDQLETLDLSLGTMTAIGADALLASSKVPSLKKLNLHYHFIPNEQVKKLKSLPIIVDVSEQQDDEDDYRYPSVTE